MKGELIQTSLGGFRGPMDELVRVRTALDECAMVAATDCQGRVTYVNDRFCSTTGYSREDWIGADIRHLCFSHYSKPFFQELWNTLAGGGNWRGEIQGRAQDGSSFWGAMTITPILDEHARPREYLTVGVDITENKRLQTELQTRKHLKRLLVDFSSQFVALPNEQVDEAILRILQQIVEFWDLDRATLWQLDRGRPGLNLTHHWQRPGMPALPTHFRPEGNLPWAHQKIMLGESFHFTSLSELPPKAARDVEIFRRHGSKSKVCIPLMATGRFFGALAFATVRKERKWLPDEVVELNLVTQIIANVIGRQRAEERAEQLRAEISHTSRTSVLGELAAALAHELNQPLTAILGNAQAGRRFIANGGTQAGEVGTILDEIVRDSRRAGSVVHNLSAMLSNAAPPRERCNLNEVIREVAEFMHGMLVGENIELRQQLDPSLADIHAARVEIQQVLVNLLINAVQAMKDTPEGSRLIDIRSQTGNTRVTVTVQDRGCGIPPRQTATVFQPFFTTKKAGLGMGLTICRRMIEAHGGSIIASNHHDCGAKFVISLPVCRAAAATLPLDHDSLLA